MEVGQVGNAGSIDSLKQSEKETRSILELGQDLKKVQAAEEGKVKQEEAVKEAEAKEQESDMQNLFKEDEKGNNVDMLG